MADTWNASLDFHMLACSGATTKNIPPQHTGAITPAAGVTGQYHELAQIDQGYLDENTTLVTISIGGNDLGFGEVVPSCIGGFCNQTLAQLTAKINNVVAPAVSDVLAQIHSHAPNAKIFLMGYPKLFENGGDCLFIGANALPTLNPTSDALNGKLSSLTTSFTNSLGGAPTKFGDPVPLFTDRELCIPQSAINALVLTISPGEKPVGGLWPNTTGVSSQSVHPNKQGTDIYAQVMTSQLVGFY